MPSVAVVIPTFNRRVLLERALHSVWTQTYQVTEAIVADDGSTDDTVTWLRSLSRRSLNLVTLPHSGNVAALRNHGAALASTEYLAFLDSDDWWHPDKLQRQMEHAPFGWSFGGVRLEDGSALPVPDVDRTDIARALLDSRELGATLSTLVINRKLFDRVGGFDPDPRIRLLEDWDLVVRLALQDPYPAVVSDPIATIGLHEGRSTAQRPPRQGHTTWINAYMRRLRNLPARLWPTAGRRLFAHARALVGSLCRRD